MCFKPQYSRRDAWIDREVSPPRSFVDVPMDLSGDASDAKELPRADCGAYVSE